MDCFDIGICQHTSLKIALGCSLKIHRVESASLMESMKTFMHRAISDKNLIASKRT